MAYLLCIETSTTNCSVAVSKDNDLLSIVEKDSKNYSHAEQLHLFIEKALLKAKISKSQLNAIAISQGPGSYTGLRIGVSSAKGLCYALGIPLISVSTLQSLAAQANDADVIIPMLDARRMEVYTQTFSIDLEPMNKIEAKVLDNTSFANEFDKKRKINFIGNGVKKFQDISNYSEDVSFIHVNPSAREMIVLANKKNKQHQFEDVAYFEPFYLKDFVSN